MVLTDVKNMVQDDFLVEDVLDALTKCGICPNLIYDDNGMWALETSGLQSVRLGRHDDLAVSFFIEANNFKFTIREAIKYGVEQL